MQPGHKWHDEAVATLATITRWWDAWDNLADDDLISPGFIFRIGKAMSQPLFWIVQFEMGLI
jgi:hypothetical protein